MLRSSMGRRVAGVVALTMVCAFACEKKETTPPDADASPPGDEGGADAEPEEVDAPEEDAPEEAVVLNKASFDETINANMQEVSDCYLAALEGNADLAGTLTTEFAFDADGKVTAVTVVEGSTLSDEGLVACINERAQAWEFGRPPNGAMSLQYPFTLEPG